MQFTTKQVTEVTVTAFDNTNSRNMYKAVNQMAAEYKENYIKKASKSARESKHFDIGFDGYYNSDAHIELLKTFGYNTVQEANAAFESSDWYKAYELAGEIYKLTAYNSPEHNAIVKSWAAAGFWTEEDHRLDGIKMLELATIAAPKQAQLLSLMAELGLEIPVFGWR